MPGMDWQSIPPMIPCWSFIDTAGPLASGAAGCCPNTGKYASDSASMGQSSGRMELSSRSDAAVRTHTGS